MQAVAQVARGQILSILAGKRPAIYRENHRQCRLVNQQRFERRRRFQIGDALADLNRLDAGNRHNVAGRNLLGFVAL